MPNLKHPETGRHTRASAATAERLVADGWELVDAPAADEEPKPKRTKSEKAASDEDTE